MTTNKTTVRFLRAKAATAFSAS